MCTRTIVMYYGLLLAMCLQQFNALDALIKIEFYTLIKEVFVYLLLYFLIHLSQLSIY